MDIKGVVIRWQGLQKGDLLRNIPQDLAAGLDECRHGPQVDGRGLDGLAQPGLRLCKERLR